MSKYIVSANYRDRNSKFNWLVRQAGQAPEQAIACTDLRVVGVSFEESSEFESGFGCKLVAKCDDVMIFGEIEPNKEHSIPTRSTANEEQYMAFIQQFYGHEADSGFRTRLIFNGEAMCKLVPVTSANRMWLDYDKHMHGVVPS